MAKRKISNRLRKKRRRRFRIFLLLTFIVSIISLATYSANIFFRINEVEIVGNVRYSVSEITENLDIQLEDSLVFFEKNKAKENLMEKYPYIKTISIKRDYPDKLIVEITEHEDFATIFFAGTHYSVSQTGKVLSGITISEVNTLPKIIGFETISLEIGQVLQSSEEYKEQLLSEIIQIFIDYGFMDIVTEIDITRTYDIIVKCGTKYQLEFGGIDDIDHKMKMFEEVIKKLTPSDTVVIDLTDKSYARFRTEEIKPSVYP